MHIPKVILRILIILCLLTILSVSYIFLELVAARRSASKVLATLAQIEPSKTTRTEVYKLIQSTGLHWEEPSPCTKENCSLKIEINSGFSPLWRPRPDAPLRAVLVLRNEQVQSTLLYLQPDSHFLAMVRRVDCYPCSGSPSPYYSQINATVSTQILTPASSADQVRMAYDIDVKELFSLKGPERDRSRLKRLLPSLAGATVVCRG